ncbi:MAG: DUF4292 domain-containing protein [Flavobacteriales bacterium]|nr:DUF4292 domain-containing protein [Flavobacteriales bacterium]
MSLKTYIFLFTAVGFLSGCSSTKGLSSVKATEKKTSKEVIFQHNQLNFDFSTVAINGSVKYQDSKQSIQLTSDIRWEKDQKILITLRMFGITGAKALITPTEVKYYEKANNTYFEGDFGMLSQWLGTEMDFEKVQNLLLGKVLENISPNQYESTLQEGWFALTEKNPNTWQKNFWLESGNFLLKKQAFKNLQSQDTFEVFYEEHQKLNQGLFPKFFKILAQQTHNNLVIDVRYNQLLFNEKLTFPYQVPSGYQKVEL